MGAKIFAVLCICAYFGQVRSSAIPMWEFLSKQEKTSFLYSLFATEVEEFCKNAALDNCNHQLLKHGLNTLKDLSEQDLDMLDPYQRGADNMIWETLMRGHPMVKTTPKPGKISMTTTAKPNSYEDESFDDYAFGSQASGSAKIETVYKVPPPKGFVFRMASGTPLYAYPNALPVEEKKGPYTRFVEQYTTYYTTAAPSVHNDEDFVDIPLTGPMVVKVYPDGSPVQEPKRPLPYDEDLRQYQMSKVKLPNL